VLSMVDSDSGLWVCRFFWQEDEDDTLTTTGSSCAKSVGPTEPATSMPAPAASAMSNLEHGDLVTVPEKACGLVRKFQLESRDLQSEASPAKTSHLYQLHSWPYMHVMLWDELHKQKD
jgi:hypothetical protein